MGGSSVARAPAGKGAHRCPSGVETAPGTPASPVACGPASGDAATVALAALLVPSTLRRCPLCGADAIAAVSRTDSGGRARCEVRCGGCATWRAIEGRRRRVDVLERRMEAILRADRRRMALALRRTLPVEPAAPGSRLHAS